jgi:hypothetical protein
VEKDLADKIQEVCEDWAKNLSIELKNSLEKALHDGGSNNPQQAALTFNPVVKVDTKGNALVQIVATGDYWAVIEDGRKPNSKMPPPDKVGGKWMSTQGIDPRQILAEIEAKRKGGLSPIKNGLSKQKKALSYNEAAKRLSFVFARSIGRKGIEAKPYIKSVINDEAIEDLTDRLSEVMGKDIETSLSFGNEFKNIKVEL